MKENEFETEEKLTQQPDPEKTADDITASPTVTPVEEEQTEEVQAEETKEEEITEEQENSCCDRGGCGCSAGLRGGAGGKKDCRTERGLFCAGGDGGSGSERYALFG